MSIVVALHGSRRLERYRRRARTNRTNNNTTTTQQQHNNNTTTTQQQHNNNTTTTQQQHNNNTTTTQQQHNNNTTTTQQQTNNKPTTKQQQNNNNTTTIQQQHNSNTTAPQQHHDNTTTTPTTTNVETNGLVGWWFRSRCILCLVPLWFKDAPTLVLWVYPFPICLRPVDFTTQCGETCFIFRQNPLQQLCRFPSPVPEFDILGFLNGNFIITLDHMYDKDCAFASTTTTQQQRNNDTATTTQSDIGQIYYMSRAGVLHHGCRVTKFAYIVSSHGPCNTMGPWCWPGRPHVAAGVRFWT